MGLPNQRLHPAPRLGAGVGHLVINSVGWTFPNQQSLAARVSREPLGHKRANAYMNQVNLRRYLNRKTQPILVELKPAKGDWIRRNTLVLVAVLSLTLNVAVVLYTVWPDYSAEILSTELCFDNRVPSNKAYVDSLYVRFRLYNSGNKPLSFYKYAVDISDPKDTTLGVLAETVSVPSLVVPGEIRECYLRIRIFRVGKPTPSRPSIYLPKHSEDIEGWVRACNMTGINRILLPLDNSISLRIQVDHSGHKSSSATIEVADMVPVEVPLKPGT